MSIQDDVEDFLLYCEITKQYSFNTIKSYRQTLKKFLGFLKDKGISKTEEVNLRILNQYRRELNQTETNRKTKMSLTTQAYQVVVLRSFIKFLLKNGVELQIKIEDLELPKTRMHKIEYLTETEIQRLIHTIIHDKSNLTPVMKKRNQAMVLTLFGSGLRISELLSLKVSQVQTQDSRLIIQGKGGKVRTTFLSPVAQKNLLEYLELRKSYSNPYLFISFAKTKNFHQRKDSQPLTPRMIQHLIRKYTEMSGIQKTITPHSLRHSFATRVLQMGGDLRLVQTLLGHSNIATTQIYTHITDTQIQDIHRKAFN